MVKYNRKPKSVALIKRTVNRMLKSRAEHKFYDVANSTVCSTTGLISQLFEPPQNDLDTGRTGDVVRLQKIECRYEGYLDVSLNNTYNSLRFIIFQWHCDSVPVLGDILALSTDIRSPYAVDANSQYTVLYDRTLDLDINGRWNKHVSINKSKRFRKKVQFIGGTLLGTGKIYGLQMSNATSNGPILARFSRITYTDF